MSSEFTVKFWGVRGSHPAPGAGTVRYGGSTSCVDVRAGDHIIVLDAGTGIIPLGHDLARRAKTMGQPLDMTLLLSHLHHDHTQARYRVMVAFKGQSLIAEKDGRITVYDRAGLAKYCR